jgi:hypothetical protein
MKMVTEFLSQLEKKMIDNGFDSFSLKEKNDLVAILANREGVMYSEITPEYILNHHKQIKTDILSENCDETIVGGFTSTNGNKYRLNRDDQMNMIGKMIQLQHDPSIATVQWKTEGMGYVSHTKDEWINKVFLEALSFKEANLFKYNTLKAQVSNAMTDAEVLAVKFE